MRVVLPALLASCYCSAQCWYGFVQVYTERIVRTCAVQYLYSTSVPAHRTYEYVLVQYSRLKETHSNIRRPRRTVSMPAHQVACRCALLVYGYMPASACSLICRTHCNIYKSTQNIRCSPQWAPRADPPAVSLAQARVGFLHPIPLFSPCRTSPPNSPE